MSGYIKHRLYSGKKTSSKSNFIAKASIVLLSMILSGLLLLLFFSFFSLKADFPLTLAQPLSLTALYLCSFIGGAVSSALIGDTRSYIGALLASCAFVIIVIALKAVIPQSTDSEKAITSLILHALIIAISIIGVFINEKIRIQKNRRHKIRR